MTRIRKWILSSLALLMIFTACSSSSPQDFYSCTRSDDGVPCTIWLGMTRDEVAAAAGPNTGFVMVCAQPCIFA